MKVKINHFAPRYVDNNWFTQRYFHPNTFVLFNLAAQKNNTYTAKRMQSMNSSPLNRLSQHTCSITSDYFWRKRVILRQVLTTWTLQEAQQKTRSSGGSDRGSSCSAALWQQCQSDQALVRTFRLSSPWHWRSGQSRPFDWAVPVRFSAPPCQLQRKYGAPNNLLR